MTERKAGQFLADMKAEGQIQQGGDQKSKGHDVRLKLSDIGVEPQESKRWQKIAAIPEEQFEEAIKKAKKKTQAVLAVGFRGSAGSVTREVVRRAEAEGLDLVAESDRRMLGFYADALGPFNLPAANEPLSSNASTPGNF